MRRRRVNNRTVLAQAGDRSSIGDYYVTNACKALDHAAQREVAQLTSRRFTTSDLIPALFHPDVITALKVAARYANMNNKFCSYDLPPHSEGSVMLTFKDVGMLSPSERMIDPQDTPTRHEFFETARLIRDAHIKWGAVKHMLRWFNRNATSGAVRALWPAVMVLCKDSPPFKELTDPPVRYQEPPRLPLNLVRETAGIVAQMQLLGDRPLPDNYGTSLTLPAGKATYAGTEINLDALTFNL